MSNKKGNRVPWSGHWEVTGSGMGVVKGYAGTVKSVQTPKDGEPLLQHNPPAEALKKLVDAQREKDAKLMEARRSPKAKPPSPSPAKK